MNTSSTHGTVFSLPRCVHLVALALALLVAVSGLALALPTPVRAASIVVNTCASNGVGSLAAAVAGAASGDTITFAQDCTGAGAITLLSTLTISKNVTIDATGRSVTISGGGTVQQFAVNSGITLTLTGLTLANGKGTLGGAIANNGGTLMVTGSTFSGNSTPGGFGGAIYSNGGTVQVTGSTFSGNSASGGFGGAIYNNGGMLTVTGSTFSGNSVPGGGLGGAIYNKNGTLNVTGNTFSGNSAPLGLGGAIDNDVGGTLNVTGSTFSGNSAPLGLGGAIDNDVGGTLNVTGSTFSGNSAPLGIGGAIDNNGTLALTLSVVAGNTAPTGPDIGGTVATDGGGNVIGDTAGSTGLIAASDKLNVAALLGPLASNGGPTQTFALLPGSPAIDIAPCPALLTTDQRGIMRPQGALCDAGSFEVLASPQSFIVTRVADDVNDANCNPAASGGCTLREAVNASNQTAGSGANTITFSPTTFASPQTITLLSASGSALTPSHTVTIDATGRSVTISGNNTVGLFFVNSSITLTLKGLTLANGKGGQGGAIFNNGGTLTVTGSTFSGNSASGGGQGGAIFNNGNTLTVTGSTFSSNSAPGGGQGGAIFNNGTLTVTGSTFSGNSAPGGGQGGAIFNNGTLTLTLSVVAGNTAPTGPDIGGTVATDGGGNVIGDTAGSTGLIAASDKLNVAALLGPLASNGGPTQTFALLPGSPAIDIAPCPALLTTDQRGIMRPQGALCDAGSFESRGFAATANTGNGQSAALNTTFLAPVTLTLASTQMEPVVGGQVTFTITPGGGGASATFPAAGGCTLTSATIAVCPITGGGVATSPSFTANGSLGVLTITASASGSAPTTYSETVAPGPATHFTVSSFPSPVTSGVAGSVTVTAKDASGNTATSYTGTVHVTSSDAAAILPSNATLTNGVGSFAVTLNTAGTQSITGTDTTTASITGAQTGITVTAATVTSLTTTAPTGTGSGNGGSASAPIIRAGSHITLGTVATYNNGTSGPPAGVTYSGYDVTKISVDANGVVTALAAGTTTITITAANGVTTTITITVSGGSGGGLMAPAPQPGAKANGTAVPNGTVAAQPTRKADAPPANGIQPQAGGSDPTATPAAQPGRR